jgi:hypothetical protein
VTYSYIGVHKVVVWFACLDLETWMKLDTEEKVWMFTCAASEVQCESICDSVYVSNFCHTWIRILGVTDLTVSLNQCFKCYQFLHSILLILGSAIGKVQASYGLEMEVAKISDHTFQSTTKGNAQITSQQAVSAKGSGAPASWKTDVLFNLW